MSRFRAAPTTGPPGQPPAYRSCAHQVASRFVLAHCRLTEALRLDERGATAVEYALIAGLIAVVIAGAVALLGTTVLGLFNSAANAI